MYCRELIESRWYQRSFRPDWELKADQNAKSKFSNTAGGERSAKGMTAKVTGNRADGILVDDPNEVKEAWSEVKRNNVITAWNGIWTRVNSPITSFRMIIQQRVHEQDLTGHVLKDRELEWEHLMLPMRFEPDRKCKTRFGWEDPRTYEGELLHPDRFDEKQIAQDELVLGISAPGQLQQRPTPAGGGMFPINKWRFFRFDGNGLARPRPMGCTQEEARVIKYTDFHAIYFSIDANFKGAIKNDPVGFLGVGVIGADKFVFLNRTSKIGFMQTIGLIKQVVQEHPMYHKIIVEEKANGSAIMNSLQSEIPRIIGVEPEGGKEARASAIEPEVSAGNRSEERRVGKECPM
jgi:hypothetical protein